MEDHTIPIDTSLGAKPRPVVNASEETRRLRRALLKEKHAPPMLKRVRERIPVMILPQVHLRKPCYDFSFL